ncbi:hypothetical protein [Haliscomenobacter sp.]|uniref:hypothetical protein n=1 Tax=Haliscomenobacter sp. TaxID=2717303 RepID=UPI003364FF30
MKKNKNNPPKQHSGTMLNQKTNEDHNKQKPDPKDPNEIKNNPNTADSTILEKEDEQNIEQTINHKNNTYSESHD